MVQGGFSNFRWPILTKQFLKAETTVRRASGGETPAVKAPFMPRIAIALDSWLRESRTRSLGDQ